MSRPESPGTRSTRMSRIEARVLGWLARLLSLRRSEALTLANRRRLRQFLRFASLFGVSIIVPSLLLAWFALSSIRGEELQVDADLERRADAIATEVYQETREVFGRFQVQTLDRIDRGQSPLANLAELSPYLRASFRFDAEGTLVAPFTLPEQGPITEPSTWYRERRREGARLERAGRYEEAAEAYRTAAAATTDSSLKGQASFAAARATWQAGDEEQALRAFADLYANHANDRDRWGFRIGDLAALKRAEIALAREPDVGQVALESLVEGLLADRWTAGQPGEAAIARRALDLLEGRSDPDWMGRSRIRLEERTSQLFWAEELIDELELLTGAPMRLDPGEFRYRLGGQGSLWALLWARDSLHAFSFDYHALIADLRSDLQRDMRRDDEIFAQILSVDETTPDGTLKRMNLQPWAPQHSVVVGLQDPQGVVARKIRMRRIRLLIIALAVGMSILGVVLSLRLVGNELQAARMKTDFAANVSHELRSPITRIRLKAESLQLDLVYDDEDRQEHYDTIVHEAERLSRLVDNVLDFAAIERGAKRYTMRPEDPARILLSEVEAARANIEEQDIELEVDVPPDLPVVWMDREAIGQVMTNLLSNAAKYGGDGGWVGVRAQAIPDGVEVSVADHGVGIDDEDLDRVFDHFFRSADPDVRRRKGTGIGLSIVRYIVEAHGGAIAVDSAPGQGTTFTFTLPQEPPGETHSR